MVEVLLIEVNLRVKTDRVFLLDHLGTVVGIGVALDEGEAK